MYLRSTIIILFFSLTTFCLGQNVDSLILAAEQLNRNQQVKAYEEIGLEYYQQDFTIKAKEYFYKALELSANSATVGNSQVTALNPGLSSRLISSVPFRILPDHSSCLKTFNTLASTNFHSES